VSGQVRQGCHLVTHVVTLRCVSSVRGVEVVYRYVADVARAIAFYEAAFGMSFTRYGDDWAECTLPDGVRFGLHLAHDDRQPQPPGSTMVDLRVLDLAASHARLAMLGARPGDPQDAPTGRFVTFTDPDGYQVQVFEKKR
jgi:predicted enzyme related to lactoylglutathione lyase